MIPFGRILVVSKIYYRYIETYFLIYIYICMCVCYFVFYTILVHLFCLFLFLAGEQIQYIYIHVFTLFSSMYTLISFVINLKILIPFCKIQTLFFLAQIFSLYFKSVHFVCLLLYLAGDQLQSHYQYITLQKILIIDIYVFIL